MQFDWTINIGHIFTAMMAVLTLISLYFAVRTDVKMLQYEITLLGGRMINVENTLQQLSKTTIALATTDTKIQMIEERIDEQNKRLNKIDELGSRNLYQVIAQFLASARGEGVIPVERR